MDAVQNDSTTMYYEEHKNLIKAVVNRFVQQHHNIDFEEQLSIAHFYFVEKIVPKYDQRCKFSTWLVTQLKYYLHNNYYRKEKRENNKNTTTIEKKMPVQKQTMLIDLLDELKTEDAKHVVNLIIDTPSDLQILIEEMGGSVSKIKNTLLKYLKQNGWKTKRITKAFTQIEMALL